MRNLPRVSMPRARLRLEPTTSRSQVGHSTDSATTPPINAIVQQNIPQNVATVSKLYLKLKKTPASVESTNKTMSTRNRFVAVLHERTNSKYEAQIATKDTTAIRHTSLNKMFDGRTCPISELQSPMQRDQPHRCLWHRR